jgi:hypothetical protein
MRSRTSKRSRREERKASLGSYSAHAPEVLQLRDMDQALRTRNTNQDPQY